MSAAERSADTLRDLLDRGSAERCAAELLALAADEDARSARNALPPYADRLPPLLAGTDPARAAEVLAGLSGPQVQRMLFGSFRQLPWPWLHELSVALDDATLLRLLDACAAGVDAPRQAARLLQTRVLNDPGAVARALPPLDSEAAARLLGLVRMPELQRLVAALEAVAPDWLAAVAAVAFPPETVRLQGARDDLQGQETEPSPLSVPGHVHRLEQAGPAASAAELEERGTAWQSAVLSVVAAPCCAAVLAKIAQRDPARAGLLLGSLGEWPLVPGPGGRRRTLFRARAAAVLEASDPDVRDRLVGLLDERVRPELCARLLRRHAVAYPPVQVSGCRRRRRLGEGVELVQIREQRVDAAGPVPMRIDLLELDPRQVHLSVCRAAEPVPFSRLVDEVGMTGRGQARPDEAVFRRLGLVRLSDVVAQTGAVAALNGNFYIDYGHYLDGLDLGIDLAGEPHVLLGDAIGWFVSGGEQLASPVAHRATLVVTEDADVTIRRVFARCVVLRGVEHTWDRVDVPGPGRILYTRLYAEHTPSAAGVVELSISGGAVVEVRTGGGVRIPLLGFVLSVPADEAGDLRHARPDEPVVLPPTLPDGLGPVRQAMSCGPLLVRDGQVDVDLALEGFGDKDTGVLPLSLTRAVDTFSAARSFVMTRSGRVVLGAVSGTQVGMGPVKVSAGMTFGELAQLCADLGAEDAMGLDGGGSSALLAGLPDGPLLVSVPTGGSDVPAGAERFLSTYLLATGPS